MDAGQRQEESHVVLGDISRKQKCNCTMSLKIKSQISSKYAEQLVAWRTINNGLQIMV
jgi:hypothetical protein